MDTPITMYKNQIVAASKTVDMESLPPTKEYHNEPFTLTLITMAVTWLHDLKLESHLW